MLFNSLKYKNTLYHLKFTIKDLIDIASLDINANDIQKQLFYLSIKDDISLKEKNKLYKNLTNIEDINKNTLRFSNGDDTIFQIPAKDINFLYSLIVGEVGILSTEFYNMSLMEIFFVYKGYLKRLENQAKLQQLSNSKTHISLVNDIITTEEKDNFLKELGIGGNHE